MIGLPCVPDPSSLLWTEGLSRRAVTLQDECRQIVRNERHRPIESIYQDARDLHDQGDFAGCAVILIHLSDACRAKGKLGLALKFSKEVEKVLLDRPRSKYKHNQAVAFYSLGLIHQLLGSDQEAWDYYDRALDAFQQAKELWFALRATYWEQRCDDIQEWLEQIMAYVARARAHGGVSAIWHPILVGCWPPTKSLPDVDQLFIDVTVEEIAIDMLLHRGNDTYRLERLGRGIPIKPTIQPGEEYYVLKVPGELQDDIPQFADVGYILVGRDVRGDYISAGAVIKDGEILWGEFTRDEDGDIRLEVTNPVPKIIGIDDSDRIAAGKIIALLIKDGEILWGEFTRDEDGNIRLEVTNPVPKIIGIDDLDQSTMGRIVGVFKQAD